MDGRLMALGLAWMALFARMIPFRGKTKQPVELVLVDTHLNVSEGPEAGRTLDEDRRWLLVLSETLFGLAVLGTTLLALKMLFHGLHLDAVRENGPSLSAGLTALGMASGLSFAIFITFAIIMKTMQKMKTRAACVLGWMLTAVFCGFSVGTSAWFSFVGTSGLQALAMHVSDTVEILGKDVERATAQIKVARGIPEALDAKAEGFRAQASDEVKKGGATGSAGSGLVSQTLGGAAAVLTTGARGIREALAQADQDAAVLREKMRTLRVVARERGRPVLDRERVVQQGAGEVQALLSALNDAGLKERVEATLVAVRSSVAELDAGGSAFGQRQRDAIGRIRADMQDVAARLEAISAGFTGIGTTAEASVRVASLPEIAWAYKAHFIPMLMISIGLELFGPFALAWMAVFGMEGKRRRQGGAYEKLLDLDERPGSKLLDRDALAAMPEIGRMPMAPKLEPVPAPTPRAARKATGQSARVTTTNAISSKEV